MKRRPFPLLLILYFLLSSYVVSANEPDCVVQLYSTVCDLREGKLIQTDTIIIQINNRNGEENCDIEIPYSKNEPIIHFSAWIRDADGIIIRQLKRQDYRDENEISDHSLYEDYFVRKFTLKHNVYPYCIGYTWQTISRQFIGIADWSPVIDTDIPTRIARLVLISPEDYPVHVYERNIGTGIATQFTDIKVRTWNASYDGSVKMEPYCPPLGNFLPFVKIIPLQFTYGISGSTENWQAFGEWQFNLIGGLRDLPESEKQKVRGLIQNVHVKKEIVEILYHYLQDNTHYINVTLDIGGLKPYPAQYVASNKYGDCKALTNYMMALLAFSGIKSYYTTIYAGDQPRPLITDLPSQQFNHVVLTVPVANDTLWLENTDNASPFGYISTFIQNRSALLVDSGRSRIIHVPSLQPEDVKEERKMIFSVNANSMTACSLDFIFRGYRFDVYNSLLTQYSRNEQTDYIHKHLPFSDFELSDWKIIKLSRNAKELELQSNINIQGMLHSLGNERYFSPVSAEIPELESPKNRKLPIQLSYPKYVTDTLVYRLPSLFSQVTLPENRCVESKFGKYRLNFKLDGNNILVTRQFLLNAGYYSLNEYSDFYNFIATIKAFDKNKILIQQP